MLIWGCFALVAVTTSGIARTDPNDGSSTAPEWPPNVAGHETYGSASSSTLHAQAKELLGRADAEKGGAHAALLRNEALGLLRSALAVDPEHPASLLELPRVLSALGRGEESVAAALGAVERLDAGSPAYALALRSLAVFVVKWQPLATGLLLRVGGLLTQFLDAARGQQYPPLWLNLGIVREHARDLPGARVAYQRTIDILAAASAHDRARFAHEWVMARVNLGNVYFWQDDVRGAKALYESVVLDFESYGEAAVPAWVLRTAASSLGFMRLELGDHAGALNSFELALRFSPGSWYARVNLMIAQRAALLWDGFEALQRRVVANGPCAENSGAGEEAYAPLPYDVSLMPVPPRWALANAMCTWRSLLGTELHDTHAVQRQIDGSGGWDGSIRVGYFTRDLGQHPMGRLTRGLFRFSDKSRFKPVVLAYGKTMSHIITRRFQREAWTFMHLADATDTQAAEVCSTALGLHVFVDLMAHTRGTKRSFLALKPAPIMINYLGFPGTTGSQVHDYIVVDAGLVTVEARPSTSEYMLLVPHSYQANEYSLDMGVGWLAAADWLACLACAAAPEGQQEQPMADSRARRLVHALERPWLTRWLAATRTPTSRLQPLGRRSWPWLADETGDEAAAEGLRCSSGMNPDLSWPGLLHESRFAPEIFERKQVSLADGEAPPHGTFVFACFNKAGKIEPRVFHVWLSILRRVPGSVLLMNVGQVDTLRAEAASVGVIPSRVLPIYPRLYEWHMWRHQHVHLFLDTQIYTAHTTASDSIWSGVPLLTCGGSGFDSGVQARVSGSIARVSGLGEMVTHSLRECEDVAVRIAAGGVGQAALARARVAELARVSTEQKPWSQVATADGSFRVEDLATASPQSAVEGEFMHRWAAASEPTTLWSMLLGASSWVLGPPLLSALRLRTLAASVLSPMFRSHEQTSVLESTVRAAWEVRYSRAGRPRGAHLDALSSQPLQSEFGTPVATAGGCIGSRCRGRWQHVFPSVWGMHVVVRPELGRGGAAGMLSVVSRVDAHLHRKLKALEEDIDERWRGLMEAVGGVLDVERAQGDVGAREAARERVYLSWHFEVQSDARTWRRACLRVRAAAWLLRLDLSQLRGLRSPRCNPSSGRWLALHTMAEQSRGVDWSCAGMREMGKALERVVSGHASVACGRAKTASDGLVQSGYGGEL